MRKSGNQARADARYFTILLILNHLLTRIHVFFRLLRYERYQTAALTIQWAYRSYRVMALTKRHVTSSSSLDASKKLNDSMLPGVAESKERWKRLLAGTGTFEDKTDLWRHIIEIRRAYSYSTDICIKALLHAEGDVSRALTIVGNAEFNFRYGSDVLPPDMYAMFFPTISRSDKKDVRGGSTAKIRLTVALNKKTRRREIKAHKKLIESLHQSSSKKGGSRPEDEEESSMIDLTDIMWKSYLVEDKRDQYEKKN